MSYSDEFPLLEGIGLYASDISGDGNCLFHALSDQLYGHENHHSEIRARIVDHMRAHASYFKLFLDVGPARRAPKRKAAAATAKKNADARAPSEDAIDVAFAQHLSRMAKSGVYGDNMEISAFARAYGCDVKIYQRDFAYVVTGDNGDDGGGDSGMGKAKGKGRKVLHIAYHTWEHYSSVRNRNGPHTGPPDVSPTPLTEAGRVEQEKKLANTSYVQPWMEKVVASSLPDLVDSWKIREALEEAKGNVNAVVSRFLDADEEVVDDEQLLQEKEKEEEEENIKKGDADVIKMKERVDVTLREGETIKEKEVDKVDAQTSPESQDNVDKVNDPAADTDEKTSKEPTSKISVRASARIRAKGGSKNNPGLGSGPENSGPVVEGTPRPKKETQREKKAKQKAAAKQKKKENALANKGAESEKSTTAITTGIKELYV
ncbi:cysteine proteinase [Choiromyces venosus 120613-1]|uniref:Cysteine proteinase n=1 Tax=Choiromyces venosus 120613-1 TaxID=1336337 RepID=A0A3N4K6C5_9PEZI|nr:cysteine proteinase [Choiromyces venosus 120613-1]